MRQKKLNKAEKARMDKSGFFERKEKIIQSVLRKISEGNKSDDFSAISRSRRSSASSKTHKTRRDRESSLNCSKCSSDSVEESSYCSSKRNKKKNLNKKYAMDKIVKNPIQKSKKKAPISNVATKDEVGKELQYTRAMWLKMDRVALGA